MDVASREMWLIFRDLASFTRSESVCLAIPRLRCLGLVYMFMMYAFHPLGLWTVGIT